jgi:hypothetical protein
MQWIEALRLGIALLTFLKTMRTEDGDKEGAVLGLFGLLAPKAGLKQEEVEVLIPEIKSLVGLLKDLRQ